MISRVFPFLRWFPISGETIRADLIAGVTVALVLIPQSMAYAQLAGLPAYYGLYAAFLPGIVQLTLGLFRLGVVVNFLSHPVIVGFTNAAARIIGLSQLNKIFGVSMPRSMSSR